LLCWIGSYLHFGDPLADFAHHVMTWRLTRKEFRGMAGHDLAVLGIPAEQDYVDTYCARVGRNSISPKDWEFYIVFSMFRLAAILHGIASRALYGTAANVSASALGARARPVADTALRQVQSLCNH